MAESDAGQGTVMRALKELEASGLITREPQFHDSGAPAIQPQPTDAATLGRPKCIRTRFKRR